MILNCEWLMVKNIVKKFEDLKGSAQVNYLPLVRNWDLANVLASVKEMKKLCHHGQGGEARGGKW